MIMYQYYRFGYGFINFTCSYYAGRYNMCKTLKYTINNHRRRPIIESCLYYKHRQYNIRFVHKFFIVWS